MRILIAILLVIAVALVAAGCGKKAEQSSATPVENPPASKQPAEPVAAKPMPPLPPPPQMTGPGASKGFTKTASGLMVKDTKIGSGRAVKAGDHVTVQYKGWLDNGTVFDTSRKPGREPFEFNAGGGQVIKGWDEGVQGMKVGGVRQLVISPDLGYGDQDMGQIPPNSTLHFEVELLKIGS